MTRATSVLLAFLFVGAAVAGQIEVPDWEGSVHFALLSSQEPVRPGDAFEVAVVVDIVEGYHLYGPEEQEPSRTEVAVSGEGLSVGDVAFPPVVRRDLSGLGTYDLYEGSIAIRVPVELDANAGAGERALKATVSYQVCTDFACSAPATEELSISLPTTKAGAAVKKLHPEIFESK